jgi:shikimate kinase
VWQGRVKSPALLLFHLLSPSTLAYSFDVTGLRTIENLALIGFMGTGKSSVGRAVAEMLHFDFLDTDQVIEERAGRTIAQIFADHGEAAFRDLEHRLVLELANHRRTVIATGGGLPVNPANLESLRTHALVVCLWASAGRIYERVREHTHRPLLNTADPQARIQDLLTSREPFYRQADVLINTETRPLREVAVQVMHQFQEARSRSA